MRQTETDGQQQELKGAPGHSLDFPVLFDKAQTEALISTQEISLGPRWLDKRLKKALVDGNRKRMR